MTTGEREPSTEAREIASTLFEKWDTAPGIYEETTNDLVTAIARALDAAGAEARKEVARLEQWVRDLQSGMYVNCVYCGHRYGPGETTPVSMADALKAHVEQCPKHPMSSLRRDLAEARAALRDVNECSPWPPIPDYDAWMKWRDKHAPALTKLAPPEGDAV